VRIILDTNVFVSALFFGGIPYLILQAWREDKIQIVASLDILTEYQRVAVSLSQKYSVPRVPAMLNYVIHHTEIWSTPVLPENICKDPNDDKFIACALASGTKIIVSGDKHLLDISGYQEIQVLKPRRFVDIYLKE
jgi:putative PIN family toxin of toxin-antitoxin system